MKRNVMSNIVVFIIVVSMFVSLTACGAKTNKSTPEKVAEDFVIALFTANPEKLVNSLPDFCLKTMFGTDLSKREIIDLMKSEITEDDISECVIVDSKKEDPSAELEASIFYTTTCEEMLDEYIEEMESYGATSQDLALITDYCIVSVESIVDDEERTDFIFCVKYDGNWYAIDIY